MHKKVVISDLDGTIALIDHRKHLIEGSNRNWSAFYKECVHDKANKPVVDTLAAYRRAGYTIIILTGRSDEVEFETRRWLSDNNVDYDCLFMRHDGDYTPDYVFKPKMLEQIMEKLHLSKDDILCVLEDRQSVVDMWRENGYVCFQVAGGNF